MIASLIVTMDQLLAGFTVGITIWHFFLQAPFLLKLMGKEKFVSLMMQLTRLWIQTIFVSSTMLLLCLLLGIVFGLQITMSLKLHWPILGWMAVAVNKFVIVPKALKAGARSHNSRKGDDSKDVQDFAVKGGGKSETATLHQTVVVFVVIMTVGMLAHMIDLSTASLLMEASQ